MQNGSFLTERTLFVWDSGKDGKRKGRFLTAVKKYEWSITGTILKKKDSHADDWERSGL